MDIKVPINFRGSTHKRWLNNLIILRTLSIAQFSMPLFQILLQSWWWVRFNWVKNYTFHSSTNTIHGTLPVESLHIMPLKLKFSWCVAKAIIKLDGNCNEHQSPKKITFFSKSFIWSFIWLIIVVMEVIAAIRDFSLDWLITLIGTSTKSAYSFSR